MFWKRIQLGLIHAAVAMTLVPINSTLNRVMINELAISATLVAILASLPYLFSPIQVAIGSFSDRHPILGWRRTPYIVGGLLLCVVGVVFLPRIAFLFAENFWLGLLLALLAFGAWGMGYNLATVSYFSLATELSGKDGRSKTIAVMFFIMILSIILTAISLSRMLEPYSPEILIRSFATIGALALALGLTGIVRLEPRTKIEESIKSENYSWGQITRTLTGNPQAVLFFVYLTLLLIAILGQDILLEPFAAEAFGMSVSATTRITSIWGTFFLIFLVLGGAADGRINKLTIARLGAWVGVAAFGLILLSGVFISQSLLYIGVISLGAATGLSTVSNLSLMLDMTIPGSVGLFIGAWGMASAAARLIGNISSGVIRDLITELTANPAAGYLVVFGLEIGLLIISLLLLRKIDVSLFRKGASKSTDFRERVALAGDIG
jgi:BCD family chlorophyll transporter-like MFS transporter